MSLDTYTTGIPLNYQWSCDQGVDIETYSLKATPVYNSENNMILQIKLIPVISCLFVDTLIYSLAGCHIPWGKAGNREVSISVHVLVPVLVASNSVCYITTNISCFYQYQYRYMYGIITSLISQSTERNIYLLCNIKITISVTWKGWYYIIIIAIKL